MEFDEALLTDAAFERQTRGARFSEEAQQRALAVDPPVNEMMGLLQRLGFVTGELAVVVGSDAQLILRLAQNCVVLQEEIAALRQDIEDLRG